MALNHVRLEPGVCPSLTEEVCSKLRSEGINNSFDLLSADSEVLSSKTRISYRTIQNICKVLNAYHGAFPITGDELYALKLRSSSMLSTGYKQLDDLLGGGLLAEEVIEICGGSGSGKTALCLSIAFNASLKQMKNVIYFDPLASITSSCVMNKLENFVKNNELSDDDLQRMKIVTPTDIWDILQMLEMMMKEQRSSEEENKKEDLVIIDSLPYLLYPLLGGSHIKAFGVLNQFGNLLKTLAKEKNFPILIVNNIVNASSEEENESVEKKISKSALGRYWMHVPHTKLCLERKPFEIPESTSSTPNPAMESEPQRSSLDLSISIIKSTRFKAGSCNLKLD